MLSTRGLFSRLIRFSELSNTHNSKYKLCENVFLQRRMSTGSIHMELIMIRPVSFGSNIETAVNNVYQSSLTNICEEEARVTAIKEFNDLVSTLRRHDIEVRVFEDTPVPSKPDAVFPNNWISFHESKRLGKRIAVYPMYSRLRRTERRSDIVQTMIKQFGYKVVDYTHFEKESKCLEGTGSMVLDRVNKIAYACKSARTHPEVLQTFCEDFGYKPVLFEATFKNVPIYHTNVMMSVGEQFALICRECIADDYHVVDNLKATGKHLVNLSVEQVANFCGNALPVYNRKGVGYLAMSTRAFKALSASQVQDIEQYCKIIHSPIPIIETLGGGSVRCMLAEVY